MNLKLFLNQIKFMKKKFYAWKKIKKKRYRAFLGHTPGAVSSADIQPLPPSFVGKRITVSALLLPHSWIEPQVMWKVHFLGFFLNKPPLFAQKDHFLRYFLNWPPPKNPYWKIEPRGSIRADTVIFFPKQSGSEWPFLATHYSHFFNF